jgi:hypothetical protein
MRKTFAEMLPEFFYISHKLWVVIKPCYISAFFSENGIPFLPFFLYRKKDWQIQKWSHICYENSPQKIHSEVANLLRYKWQYKECNLIDLRPREIPLQKELPNITGDSPDLIGKCLRLLCEILFPSDLIRNGSICKKNPLKNKVLRLGSKSIECCFFVMRC